MAVFLLCTLVYGLSVTILSPVRPLKGDVTYIDTYLPGETVQMNWPKAGQSAIGALGYGVLASKNTQSEVPSASVIKLVTALAILEKHPLKEREDGPVLTITQRDVDILDSYIANNGSVMLVRVGQQLTQRQALEALLLRSANNIADTLVEWAYGSQDEYRKFATDYLKRAGLYNTKIGKDASGLDPGSQSTATDLVKLGAIVMDSPALRSIVGEKSAQIPDVGVIHNTNYLLGTEGIVGIKTGTDYQDRGNYLFASEYKVADAEQITIIGSVMQAKNSDAAKKQGLELLASARTGFAKRTIVKSQQRVATFSPEWLKDDVGVISESEIASVAWRDAPLRVHIKLNQIDLPAKQGQMVGSIQLADANNKPLSNKKTAIKLTEDITAPSLWWRLSHPFETWQFAKQ